MHLQEQQRQRAYGARSRKGCLTCRARHVRCDEGRPSCGNCAIGSRQCEYAPTTVPLRERKTLDGRALLLPGQRGPWSWREGWAVESVAVGDLDPFDSLPIKMPFKSKNLFRYFHQADSVSGVTPLDPRDDCVALAALDEYALRGTLLIAGLHYAWNTGSLQEYQAAFLFHKVESIRNVNQWLEVKDDGGGRSAMAATCVRYICTLCLVEVCLGNIPAAETHLEGLMTLLDVHEREGGSSVLGVDDADSELANRYLVLTYNFVHLLKSRLMDYVTFRKAFGIGTDASNSTDDAADVQYIMKQWHITEQGGLESRLKSMRLFPHFLERSFSSSSSSSSPQQQQHKSRPKPRKVKANQFWPLMRDVTHAVDRYRAEPTAYNGEQVWNEGGPTRLLLLFVRTHIESFGGAPGRSSTSPPSLRPSPQEMREDDEGPVWGTWLGIFGSAGLYMHGVINIANTGERIEGRLLRRSLRMLQEDVRSDGGGDEHHCGGCVPTGGPEADFFLWKVFCGALEAAKHQRDREVHVAKRASCYDAARVAETSWPDLSELEAWFMGRIRAWSDISGATEWAGVKGALGRSVWPSVWPKEEERFAEALWRRSISVRV